MANYKKTRLKKQKIIYCPNCHGKIRNDERHIQVHLNKCKSGNLFKYSKGNYKNREVVNWIITKEGLKMV